MLNFWSRKEVANYLCVKTDSINGYALPPPDAQIGSHKGWMPATIKNWQRSRPGRGNWHAALSHRNRSTQKPTDTD